MAKAVAKYRIMLRRARRTKMWRTGIVAVELIAGFAVVCGIATAILFWRLGQGEIAVAFLTPPIERAINAQLTDYSVRVRETVIERSEKDGVQLRLKSVVLRSKQGAVIATVPKVAIAISPLELLGGQIAPNRIELIGVRVAVIYDRDGRVRIGLDADRPQSQTAIISAPSEYGLAAAETDDAQQPAAAGTGVALMIAQLRTVLAGGGGQSAGLGSIREIGISDTTAAFVHERLDRRWEIKHGDLVLALQNGELHLDARARVDAGGQAATIRADATLRDLGDGIELAGTVSDIVPREIAQGFDSETPFLALDMPVTASLTSEIADDGTLRGGSVTAVLGAGFLRVLGKAQDGIFIDEGALRLRYDAATRIVSIDNSELFSGQSRATLSGQIVGAQHDGADPDLWRYSLSAKDVKLGSADVRVEPINVDLMTAQGGIDLAHGFYTLDRGEFVAGAVGLALSGNMSLGGDAPRIRLAGSFSPMTTSALKSIWPQFLMKDARKWVLKNVADGRVTGATLIADLDREALERIKARQPLAPEMLNFTFGFKDLSFSYIDDMPLLQGLAGTGELSGSSFTVLAENGHVPVPGGGRIEVANGRFEIPNVEPKIPDGGVSVALSGATPDLLRLLDHEPLGALKGTGLAPGVFGGTGAVALRVAMPLRENLSFGDVILQAEAELVDVSAKAIFAGHDMSDGRFLINSKAGVVSMAGDARIAAAPAHIAWSIPLSGKSDQLADPQITLDLDDALRQTLNLSSSAVTGPVQVTIVPDLPLRKKSAHRFAVHADLTKAALSFAGLGYDKAAGEPATLIAEVTASAAQETTIKAIEYEAGAAMARGEVVLDRHGALRSADFPMFRLAAGDSTRLTLARERSGSLQVTLSGKRFDARGLMQQIVGSSTDRSSGADGSQALNIAADVDEVLGLYGAQLVDVNLQAKVAGGQVSSMKMTGRFDGQDPVQASIKPHNGVKRFLLVETGNAGAAFRFSGIYKRVEGGALSLSIDLPEDSGGVGEGVLKASDFYIRGEPALGRISAAAVAEGGFDKAPDSSRVRFDALRMPFQSRPGTLILGESVLRGPSVGGTVEGRIDFVNKQVDLAGTYIPAYAVNNLLSHVPVVGKVLMGGEGGGLLGLTFAIRGSSEEPVVTVNPASVVTPGLFRKIFDFSPTGSVNGKRKERDPLPSAPVVQ